MNSVFSPRNPRHCRVCLVRHGETPWNTERRLQGHIDIPLNDKGLAQAAAAARSLAGQPFAAIYTSDLERARHTAAAVANAQGLATQDDPRLRERHYGVFQGLTYDEAAARHPEAYLRFKERDPEFAFPEGGESLLAFSGRIREALDGIAQRHGGEQVLVVTHGGVLDIAHRLATGKPLDAARDFAIPNAALNWIEHDGESWHLLAWAVQDHLDGALDELPTS